MQNTPPIAIVGMSALFAGSDDVLGFWRDVVSATDRLSDVPPHHWLIDDYYDADPSAPDMTYAKRGGFLNGIPFDSMEFGMPPTSIPATDSAQLLALIAAKRVLADAARFREGEVDHDRTSVILGVASATELTVQMGSRLQHPIWRKALRDAGLPESKVQEVVKRIGDHYQPWQESTFPGLLGNVVAGRIANRLDLGGSNFVTDAACASSISALQAGLSELYLGDSDMVIAGGVDALNDILMYMCFSKTPAFSPTGDCRPFSEEADGTLIGEGVGMIAIRRLEDAEADGDAIYAVIRGLGASSDGKGTSVYAPRPAGQAKALTRAYDRAGYGPRTVELVEGHGTATKAGDAAEVRGLTSVFQPADPDGRAWCALGSVKSQIGHTKAAAGSAGLIKVALALHHKILPPTLKVGKPNAQLVADDAPLYVNSEARPWIRGSDHPRRGSVSSFGFGGSNFHVALEEYTGPGRQAERLRAWPDELVLLSAPSEKALAEGLNAVLSRIEDGYSLARIAYDCLAEFDASETARVALVASDVSELGTKVSRAVAALADGSTDRLPDADISFGSGAPAEGRLAFLFPGQGSQYVGMGGAAAMTFERARAVWDAAADLEVFADAPLDRAVFPPPAFTDDERAEQQRRVTEMDTAQPAIAAVSLGYLGLMRDIGLKPDAVAGHSFGEVSALAAAGRLEEDALLPIARRRGQLMAEAAASQAGAMLAVSSDVDTVAGVLGDESAVVIANDNAPTEVVIAGSVEDVGAAEVELQTAGLTTFRLPVASAFHSTIVAGSSEPFHDYLASVEWADGTVDVYANTTGASYPADVDEARRLLADQGARQVRFREMIDAMYEAGVTRFIEVGPGRVLTKLVGRCLGDRPHRAISLDDKGVEGLRAFWRGLGRLAADGVELDLAALAEGYRVPGEPVPLKPHQILVTGSNHEKPYPPENGVAGLPAPNPERTEPVATPVAPAAVQPSPVTPAPVPAPAATAWPAPVGSAPAHAVPADPAAAHAIHDVTIQAHRRYQELMAESHRTFLHLASGVMGQMHGVASSPMPAASPLTGAGPLSGSAALSAPGHSSASNGHLPPAPVAIQSVAAATAQPVPAPAAPPQAPAPVVPAVSVGASTPTDHAPAPVAAAAPTVDTTALALEVVSEKTGYPVDMLDLDMEMEAGLGIDSIKQVEILSELQARVPGMPEIEPSELANLRTLRDVADKLSAAGPVSAAPAASDQAAAGAAAGALAAPAASTVAASAVDTTALALEVVSEKTGYPVEMLDLDMEMEAGLGIDSIKQVEILSELQARVPGMPEIEPSELANLRTLRDVADKLSVAGPVPAAPVAAAAASAVDTTALALEVVSEKTGYPVEMLDLDMEMEAGLGIDSIKQVEILSELQARVPGMPEIEPSELANLRTLRDVADKLTVAGPETPTAAPAGVAGAQTPTSAPRAAPAIDTTALALEVVAEKTGYPVEMLDLDMEMEAGLGIDSIKQVEILSELQARVPGMPEIEPSELANLRTLRDVADKLGPVGSAATAGTSAADAPAPVVEQAATAIDTTALALEVVAEKTGYPVEMLDLDMEMEAGLGIDSIKQVEILSELQERVPGMPEIEPSELANLRTLRDVADKLRVDAPADRRVAVTASPSIPTQVEPTPVAAFVPVLVPELRPGFGLAALSREPIVQVTNELPSLAEKLVAGLVDRGVSAEVVDAVTPTAAVISLAGLVGGDLGPEASVSAHVRAIQAARYVAQHPDPSDRLFVTIQSTGGDFGLRKDPGSAAWLGGLTGIVKTAAREWPGASLKAIDVESPEAAAEEILDELFHGGPALEVGISADGVRGVVRIDPLLPAGSSTPALKPGSVVVVSGGARGVTASSVARLAEEWNLRLALLGRSQLGEWPEGIPLSTDAVQLTGALAAAAKDRGETVDLGGIQKQAQSLAAGAEVRLSLADLDARGIETLYLSADVTDRAQVGIALDHVREKWGSISGIVHGAGVLRDKAIAEMTPDRVEAVFAPKVGGLATLLDATREDPIEIIALFSSIAARSGNAGQAGYAAANEVLNKVASTEAARRGDSCRVRSYNWGPWAGGMVDAGLAVHFEKQGIALLSIDAGTQFFVDELGTPGEGVERVVLAAASFPQRTQRLTFAATGADLRDGSRGGGVAPAMVADLALRLGHALKPMHTMRTYLEDFVIGKLSPGEEENGAAVQVVDIVPVEGDGPGYRMIFRDAEGVAHHETLVLYSEGGAEPPPSVPSGGLQPWPMKAKAAYETILNRAAGFQSIEELEGVSEEGGMALLRSVKSLEWPPKGFALGFDPAMLDGLLQLGTLWTHQKSGAAQTLARMGSMVVHRLGAFPERLRSAFRARQTDTGTLFDFIVATEEGDLVAELREVEFDTQGA